jgi:guanyl-specific ribonuclease Sa
MKLSSKLKAFIQLLACVALAMCLAACGGGEPVSSPAGGYQEGAVQASSMSSEQYRESAVQASSVQSGKAGSIDRDGTYTSKEEVAAYIKEYGKLPSNYITKEKAQELGWSGGSLEKYAPGKSIGGDRFGNYEGLLPKKDGRTYTECDIDTLGASSRGSKRIVFSNDGLIFYTDDHYNTFTQLE